MGQATAGVVGAAIGRRGKAVAIVGDGAMLMNNEISTAVKYRAQAVWVVLNDDRYGITHQGMEAWGFTPVETELPPTDFARLAQALGAEGIRVACEAEVEAALDRAMEHDGPFVVDVATDRAEIPPVVKSRIERLRGEGKRNAN
jgi:acetolactate synthase-1/2/3 large subunit